MLEEHFIQTIFLTLKLASVTTVLLFFISVPLAFYLSSSRGSVKSFLEIIITLPLVLPPTVIGFYLLLLFSPGGTVGVFFREIFDVTLIFSFSGLVMGSIIYSLPFMVQPLQAGLEKIPGQLIEASTLMGKTKWQTLFRVQLPNCKPAIYRAIALTFTHTMGEFGIVLMIGGNIPGETRLASMAIYDSVESLDYARANQYALILISITIMLLVLVHWWRKKPFIQ
jgi:molybdate transport system permease protein